MASWCLNLPDKLWSDLPFGEQPLCRAPPGRPPAEAGVGGGSNQMALCWMSPAFCTWVPVSGSSKPYWRFLHLKYPSENELLPLSPNWFQSCFSIVYSPYGNQLGFTVILIKHNRGDATPLQMRLPCVPYTENKIPHPTRTLIWSPLPPIHFPITSSSTTFPSCHYAPTLLTSYFLNSPGMPLLKAFAHTVPSTQNALLPDAQWLAPSLYSHL